MTGGGKGISHDWLRDLEDSPCQPLRHRWVGALLIDRCLADANPIWNLELAPELCGPSIMAMPTNYSTRINSPLWSSC